MIDDTKILLQEFQFPRYVGPFFLTPRGIDAVRELEMIILWNLLAGCYDDPICESRPVYPPDMLE